MFISARLDIYFCFDLFVYNCAKSLNRFAITIPSLDLLSLLYVNAKFDLTKAPIQTKRKEDYLPTIHVLRNLICRIFLVYNPPSELTYQFDGLIEGT